MKDSPGTPNDPSAAILGAAQALFAQNGFAGTSTRSIAEGAGVNLAMIHYYFGNKEQLYRRVVELEFSELFQRIREALEQDPEPSHFVESIPAFLLDLHRQHPHLRRIMIREMIDGAPRLPTLLQEMGENGPLGLKPILEKYIRAAGPGGLPPDIPPAHLLALIFALGHGLMAFAPLINVVFGLDLETEEVADAVAASAGLIVRRALTPGKES